LANDAQAEKEFEQVIKKQE